MGLEPVKVQFQEAMPKYLLALSVFSGWPVTAWLLSARLSTGFHSGHQLPGAERLCYIVIAAQFQTDDAIHLFVAGREKDDRRCRLQTNLAAYFSSVHLGHEDVQNHQIRVYGEELLDRFPAVRGLSGDIARVFEGKSDNFPDMGIIVNNED